MRQPPPLETFQPAGDAQLAVLAPGEPCVAAQRPPPSRADARVVLDLVRAGRLLLYRAGDEAGEGLDARLVDVMQRRGVAEPYAHQAEAIERALAGEDVLVATPTASGKTAARDTSLSPSYA